MISVVTALMIHLLINVFIYVGSYFNHHYYYYSVEKAFVHYLSYRFFSFAQVQHQAKLPVKTLACALAPVCALPREGLI